MPKYTLYTESTKLEIIQFWNSIDAKIRFWFLKDTPFTTVNDANIVLGFLNIFNHVMSTANVEK